MLEIRVMLSSLAGNPEQAYFLSRASKAPKRSTPAVATAHVGSFRQSARLHLLFGIIPPRTIQQGSDA